MWAFAPLHALSCPIGHWVVIHWAALGTGCQANREQLLQKCRETRALLKSRGERGGVRASLTYSTWSPTSSLSSQDPAGPLILGLPLLGATMSPGTSSAGTYHSSFNRYFSALLPSRPGLPPPVPTLPAACASCCLATASRPVVLSMPSSCSGSWLALRPWSPFP